MYAQMYVCLSVHHTLHWLAVGRHDVMSFVAQHPPPHPEEVVGYSFQI